MPLELLHTIHPLYLDVQIHGDRTPGKEFEETAELWSHIFSISRTEGLNNILAQVRVRRRFPVNAQINISFKLQEIGCSLDHRIAIIAFNREVHKNAQLIVRYMQGEGFTIRLFKSKEKAKRWLLHQKKKRSLGDLFDSFKLFLVHL